MKLVKQLAPSSRLNVRSVNNSARNKRRNVRLKLLPSKRPGRSLRSSVWKFIHMLRRLISANI